MTSNGGNFPLYCNSTYSTSSSTPPVTVSGPWLNNSGATNTSANNTNSVNQMSGFIIFDNNSTATPSSNTQPTYYFRAVATFMLLCGVLDSAPASTVVTNTSASQIPNVVMTIPGLNPSTTYYFVVLSLSAGGKTAMTPIFQTVPSSGELIFILSNYFQISVPGIIYTVTCEAYGMFNANII